MAKAKQVNIPESSVAGEDLPSMIGATIDGEPVSGSSPIYGTTDEVGILEPVGSGKVAKLAVGSILTATGLVDRLNSLDQSAEVRTKVKALIQDFAQIPLNSGLELLRDARSLVVKPDGQKERIKARDLDPKGRAIYNRIGEAQTIFTALCLVFKHDTKHYDGLGWEPARAFSSNALEQHGLTTSGIKKVSKEDREALKTDKEEAAAYAAAKRQMREAGESLAPDAVVAKAAEVREAMKLKTAEDGAVDALIALGELMVKVQPLAASLLVAEQFRAILPPETGAKAEFWQGMVDMSVLLIRWGKSWEVDKANSGDAIRLAAHAREAAQG